MGFYLQKKTIFANVDEFTSSLNQNYYYPKYNVISIYLQRNAIYLNGNCRPKTNLSVNFCFEHVRSSKWSVVNGPLLRFSRCCVFTRNWNFEITRHLTILEHDFLLTDAIDTGTGTQHRQPMRDETAGVRWFYHAYAMSHHPVVHKQYRPLSLRPPVVPEECSICAHRSQKKIKCDLNEKENRNVVVLLPCVCAASRATEKWKARKFTCTINTEWKQEILLQSCVCAEVKYLLSSATVIAHRLPLFICSVLFFLPHYRFWLTEIACDIWKRKEPTGPSSEIAVVYAPLGLVYAHLYVNRWIKAMTMCRAALSSISINVIYDFMESISFSQNVLFSLRHLLVSCLTPAAQTIKSMFDTLLQRLPPE